jgi:hypothetical protein
MGNGVWTRQSLIGNNRLVLSGVGGVGSTVMIDFDTFGLEGQTGGEEPGAQIRSTDDSWNGDLEFYIKAHGSASNPLYERFRISSRGDVVVDPQGLNWAGIIDGGLRFGGDGSGEGINSRRECCDPNSFGLDFYTSFQNRLAIANNGNVGIGTIAPGYLLDIAGTVHANNVDTSSDARFKTNIITLTDSLEKVLALRGVRYDWRREDYPERKFDSRPQIGFIAQEVEKILPEVVSKDSEGYRSVSYGKMVPVLVEAIKALQLKVAERNQLIDSLDKSNAQMRGDISELRVSAEAEKALRHSIEARLERLENRPEASFANLGKP